MNQASASEGSKHHIITVASRFMGKEKSVNPDLLIFYFSDSAFQIDPELEGSLLP